jgi:hypothetical protein
LGNLEEKYLMKESIFLIFEKLIELYSFAPFDIRDLTNSRK